MLAHKCFMNWCYLCRQILGDALQIMRCSLLYYYYYITALQILLQHINITSYASAVMAIVGMSVCLSVSLSCLPHAGICQITLHRITESLLSGSHRTSVWEISFIRKFERVLPSKGTKWEGSWESCNFQPSCHISEMVKDSAKIVMDH